MEDIEESIDTHCNTKEQQKPFDIKILQWRGLQRNITACKHWYTGNYGQTRRLKAVSCKVEWGGGGYQTMKNQNKR